MKQSISDVNEQIYSRFDSAYSIDNRIKLHQLALQGARLNSDGLPVINPTLGGNVEIELQKLQLSIIQLQLLSLSKQLTTR